MNRGEVWRATRDALAMPLVAFAAVQLVIWLAAIMVSVDPRLGASYVRWDSNNYLSIATQGYYLQFDGDSVVGGNAAWFPAYPLAIRTFKPSRLTPAKTGKLISSVFAFGLLVTVWGLTADAERGTRSLLLLLAAFFPGFIYYHAVFPISMAACLGLLAIVCCARGRYLAAGALGAIAAASYTTGFLLAAALALGVFRDAALSWGARLAALASGPLLVALGLASVLLYQQQTVGWDGFFRMQRDYCATERADVVSMFLANTRYVWSGDLRPEFLFQLETVLMVVLMLVVAGICWQQRRSLRPLEWLLLANALVFWLFPHLVGPAGRNSPRADALLVGMTPLLARLPFRGLLLLLVVFVALGSGICAGFFSTLLM
jgi:hypothetical protein